MKVKVTSCKNCYFCDFDTFAASANKHYSPRCEIEKAPLLHFYSVIHPEWCPLLKEDITVELGKVE